MNSKIISRFLFTVITTLIVLNSLGFKDLQAQNRQFHVVKQGETLYSISKVYEVTIDQLRSWNNLSGNQLSIGQRLNVSAPLRPDSPVDSTQQTENSSTQTPINPQNTNNELVRHQVRTGETLFNLSRRYGVSVNDIRTWNNLNSNLLEIGQVLNIYTDGRNVVESNPAKPQNQNDVQSSSETSENITGSTAGSAYYVVKSGDSLIRIANQFEISVPELKALNRMQGDRIAIGQVLLVRRPQGLPSVGSGTTSTTPQGQFTSYDVQRNERLNDVLKKFDMTEAELTALNPDINIQNIQQGLTLSILLPPSITYENPYRVHTQVESDQSTIQVSRYSDLDRGRSTSNGDLYNPKSYTASHDRLPLGSIVYVENPQSGVGLFVLINDRSVEQGIKLSHSAFEKLGYNLSSNNSALIKP